MRPWLLLLLSLLVSDLTPPGDGNWVMDYFSWTLCRKLILGGQMAPKGLKLLLSQTECTCFKRNYMYAVLLHKQRSFSFCLPFTVHSDHGHTLSFKDLRRIMQRDQIPVLVCLFYSVIVLKCVMSCSSLGKQLPPSSVFVFTLYMFPLMLLPSSSVHELSAYQVGMSHFAKQPRVSHITLPKKHEADDSVKSCFIFTPISCC